MMHSIRWFAVALACSLVLQSPSSILADPCGMVPPIYVGNDVPITRVGAQKTYVFYKDGVETFVIRPGFEGKVEEFGMLIPFPNVPEIRKVPDAIFSHVAAAVDPPEVVIDLTPVPLPAAAPGGGGFGGGAPNDGALRLAPDTVRVVKEEAVGMYEVAVLEAGSAKALNRWMDDHGYRYPDGMDDACNDYVDEGWCFVAVKTRVGAKAGVDPQPGQRQTNTKLPDGATFDGHVQGMGFRFPSDELVVPMRLSAFNKGELHNIVYIVTEGPMRIRSIPYEYVMRQITGEELVRNVTGPLPLRIIGGDVDDIPQWRLRNLAERRKPEPHNGHARDLFASDLLAVRTNQLSHPHEEHEKMLLRIGERLGLRGPEIDRLNEDAMAEEREKIVKDGLKDLEGMTLTVIDGDFPRDVLAEQNLRFRRFRMLARRNTSADYDARLQKPVGKKRGILVREPVKYTPPKNDGRPPVPGDGAAPPAPAEATPAPSSGTNVSATSSSTLPRPIGYGLAALLSGLFVSIVVIGVRRRN